MTKNIKIEFSHPNDVLDKYNHQKISPEVIKYLIKACPLDKNTYSIIIYDYFGIKCDLKTLIKESLIQEYTLCQNNYHQTNITQIYLLAFGIILLLISMGISNLFVFKEVILIAGWVLVWETIDIQMFRDTTTRKNIKILKKLINSNIEIIHKVSSKKMSNFLV